MTRLTPLVLLLWVVCLICYGQQFQTNQGAVDSVAREQIQEIVASGGMAPPPIPRSQRIVLALATSTILITQPIGNPLYTVLSVNGIEQFWPTNYTVVSSYSITLGAVAASGSVVILRDFTF